MLQLSEQAQKEWKNYIDTFANTLSSPEHIQAVHEFVTKDNLENYFWWKEI